MWLGRGAASEEQGDQPGEEDPESEGNGENEPHAALQGGWILLFFGRLGLGQFLITPPADGAVLRVVDSTVRAVHGQTSIRAGDIIAEKGNGV